MKSYKSWVCLCAFNTIVMLISNSLHANWDTHPLWVGYASIADGRTLELSGVIDKAFIEQFLPENPIIIDAGAYDGTDTLEMALKWPQSFIYAFEPIPNVFALLKARCEFQKNVKLYPVALSDKNENQTMYVSGGEGAGSSSLLPPDKQMMEYHPNILFDKTIEVTALTLDQWAADENISHVDLLWFDLQGMEPAILKNSPNILRTVKVIFTEVSTRSTYQNSVLYPEFKRWLESEGFQVIREDLPWLDGGNVLFIRKENNSETISS